MKTNHIIIGLLIVAIIGALYLAVDVGAARNRVARAFRLAAPKDSSVADKPAEHVVVGATDPGQTHSDITHVVSTGIDNRHPSSGASGHAPAVGTLLRSNTGVESAHALKEEARDERRITEGSQVATDIMTTVSTKKPTHTDSINAAKFSSVTGSRDNHRKLFLRELRKEEGENDRVLPPRTRKDKTAKDSDTNVWGYGLDGAYDTTSASKRPNTTQDDVPHHSHTGLLGSFAPAAHAPLMPIFTATGFGRDKGSRWQHHDEDRYHRHRQVPHAYRQLEKELKFKMK